MTPDSVLTEAEVVQLMEWMENKRFFNITSFIESKLESYASKRAEERVLEFADWLVNEHDEELDPTNSPEELAKQFNLKGKDE